MAICRIRGGRRRCGAGVVARALLEFPERRRRTARIGYVEGVVAATAAAEAADQNRLPAVLGLDRVVLDIGGTAKLQGTRLGLVFVIDVAGAGCAIDVELVLIGIPGIGQAVKVGQHGAGDDRPRLFASHVADHPAAHLEGMQHAVVGADVEHGRAAGLVLLVQRIARIDELGKGRRYIARLRTDDIAQNAGARAEQLGGAALNVALHAALSAQEIHQVRSLGQGALVQCGGGEHVAVLRPVTHGKGRAVSRRNRSGRGEESLFRGIQPIGNHRGR